MYEVVNDNMANAASVYAAEQGIDLRDFTLLAFGGAAPAHVCDVAQRLGIRRVRVPVAAGVLSALGCLASPVSFDFVFGYMRELKQVDWATVNARFAALEKEGRQHLAEAGIREGVNARYSADMRYLSQRYEVNVALPPGPLGPELLDQSARCLLRGLPAALRTRDPRGAGGDRELASHRVGAGAAIGRHLAEPRRQRCRSGREGAPPRGVRWCRCAPSIARSTSARGSAPGAAISGPAIIEDHESTAVVPPGARVEVDDLRMLVITLKG